MDSTQSAIKWYEGVFLAFFFLLLIGAGYTVYKFVQYTQTLTVKAKSQAAEQQAITYKYYPNTTVVSFTNDQNVPVLSIKGDDNILQEPRIYHAALELCSELNEKKMMPELIEVNKVRTFDCTEAMNEINYSGSVSNALWKFSYKTVEEAAIADQMMEAMRNADDDKAIILAERLVEKHPSAPNLYDLGFMHYNKARNNMGLPAERVHIAKVKGYYNQAVQADPDFAPSYASLGYFLCSETSTNNPTAEAYFQKSKETDPGWNFAWMNKSICLAAENNDEAAYQEARQAIVTNPKFQDIEYVKGIYVCMSRMTGKEESDAFYRKYEINRDNAMARCPY